jgi:hypothetical protein
MLSKLAKIANRLDSIGLTKEADSLDKIIIKFAMGAAPTDEEMEEEIKNVAKVILSSHKDDIDNLKTDLQNLSSYLNGYEGEDFDSLSRHPGLASGISVAEEIAFELTGSSMVPVSYIKGVINKILNLTGDIDKPKSKAERIIDDFKEEGRGAWERVSNDFDEMSRGGMSDTAREYYPGLNRNDFAFIAKTLDAHFRL